MRINTFATNTDTRTFRVSNSERFKVRWWVPRAPRCEKLNAWKAPNNRFSHHHQNRARARAASFFFFT